MGKWPNDLVRPVNVMIKQKGARIAFRPPKDVPEEEIVKYVIYRSTTYDYNSKCSELETPGKFDNLKVIEVTESPFIDKNFPKANTRYSYYLFAVDKEGNYHFPGMTTGKVAELGITLQEAKPGDIVKGVIGGVEPISGQGDYDVDPELEESLRNRLEAKKELWNDKKKEWTDVVLDALKKRDEQGYWVAVLIGREAPEVFLTFVDSTNELVDNCSVLVHELTHIGSRSQVIIYDGDLNTTPGIRQYILLIDDAAWGFSFPKRLFDREEILPEIPEYDGKGDFEQHYLIESGKQDFFTILNELNAYCRELRTRLTLSDQILASQQKGRTVIHSLCVFMLFTELYLKVARTKYPQDYKLMCSFPEMGLMLAKVWYNCEFLIQESLKMELGTDRLYDIVDSDTYLDEIKNYLAACGLNSSVGQKTAEEIQKLKEAARLVIKKP
ncbi:MAG: hypothetical protein GF383_16150 [Candidatus Lokiarchaeota archaeon]|nr:hypothetical protein [Candidatus Lokiarchaeota archaeon]MBD3343276.1 hypothetical protein [Candidatus Lokiarchaeota archaeon]